MILKGSQRGGATQLALHLTNAEQNEHVELHSLRGFLAQDMHGALREIQAISRGTKCQQFLFSLSLSPPEMERVPVEAFEAAIADIEAQLGLKGQPRAIVFHEKEGRRHAHCVWSRIDSATMTAIPLPHFKFKLRDISRQLYIEHGWRMPLGLTNSAERDPLNFTREEWQQAKRAGRDPKVIKTIFLDCWAISDNAGSFAQALAARGFYLAQGDRRGFVALDHQGEVYSLSRWSGVKPRDLANRLGDGSNLPTVAQTKQRIADNMTDMLQRHIGEVRREHAQARSALDEQRRRLVVRQREERQALRERQAFQEIQAARQRSRRVPKGLRAVWSWLTGEYRKIMVELERETARDQQQARAAAQLLIDRQLAERRPLQQMIRQARRQEEVGIASIQKDIANYMAMPLRAPKAEEAEPRQRNRRKTQPSMSP